MPTTRTETSTKCDFCPAMAATVEFAATSFVLPNIGTWLGGDPVDDMLSVNGWKACSNCAVLVAAGEWDALIERVTEAHLATGTLSPEHRDGWEGYIGATYQALRRHMTGEAETIKVTP